MVSKLKIVVLLALLIPLLSFSKERRNPFIINNIEVSYNFPINQISTSFFDAYNVYSNSNSSEFTYRNFPSLSLNFEIPSVTNFILSIDWISLSFSSNFTKQSSYSYNTFLRTYSENFEFNFLPISLSFFVTPFETDFKTQFHFQFGVSYDKAKWNEFINSDFEDDPRKGLRTLEIRKFSPFFAFGIRNVLPFDIWDKEQIMNFFFFETKFFLMYRNMDLFANVPSIEPLPKNVTILPFSIVLIIGVNLNTRSFFNN
ncbi:MAG: hypothetical protein ACK42G_01495 [Candidatus Kapaibacteriota bacterium]